MKKISKEVDYVKIHSTKYIYYSKYTRIFILNANSVCIKK